MVVPWNGAERTGEMTESPVSYYETEVEWKENKQGQISGLHSPPIAVGAPPEFKGREGSWTPEHLLVASLNTCYMLTFLAIVENSKLPLLSFSSTANGKLEKVPGSGYQITEIVVKPRVVISSANDLERALRLLQKAKESCFISNSIKSTIRLAPEIFHHQTPTSPCPLGEAPASDAVSSRPTAS
jgi:peroxiredoxin-like protein